MKKLLFFILFVGTVFGSMTIEQSNKLVTNTTFDLVFLSNGWTNVNNMLAGDRILESYPVHRRNYCGSKSYVLSKLIAAGDSAGFRSDTITVIDTEDYLFNARARTITGYTDSTSKLDVVLELFNSSSVLLDTIMLYNDVNYTDTTWHFLNEKIYDKNSGNTPKMSNGATKAVLKIWMSYGAANDVTIQMDEINFYKYSQAMSGGLLFSHAAVDDEEYIYIGQVYSDSLGSSDNATTVKMNTDLEVVARSSYYGKYTHDVAILGDYVYACTYYDSMIVRMNKSDLSIDTSFMGSEHWFDVEVDDDGYVWYAGSEVQTDSGTFQKIDPSDMSSTTYSDLNFTGGLTNQSLRIIGDTLYVIDTIDESMMMYDKSGVFQDSINVSIAGGVDDFYSLGINDERQSYVKSKNNITQQIRVLDWDAKSYSLSPQADSFAVASNWWWSGTKFWAGGYRVIDGVSKYVIVQVEPDNEQIEFLEVEEFITAITFIGDYAYAFSYYTNAAYKISNDSEYTPLDGSTTVLWEARNQGAISEWKDRVNGDNAVQATAGAQPAYTTDKFTFDGSDHLEIPGAAANLDIGTGDFTLECRFSATNTGNANGLFGKYFDSSNRFYLYVYLDDLYFYSKASNQVGVAVNTASNCVSDNTVHDIALIADRDGIAYFRVDGDSIATTQTVVTATTIAVADSFQIGDRGDEGMPLTGDIYAIRFSDKLRTSAEHDSFTSYLDGGFAWYVDADKGADINNGLAMDSAFATVSKINGMTIPANDQIKFRTGDTWREQLTVPASGTSGNVITIGQYDSTGESGSDPIISGADLVNTWVEIVTPLDTAGAANPGTGSSTISWRRTWEANSIAFDGNRVRFLIDADTNNATTILGMYIGETATTGDRYDMEPGTITQVTFADTFGAVIPIKTDTYSDWIAYDFDNTKDHVISIGMTGGYSRKNGGEITDFKSSDNENAGVADVTGYTASVNAYVVGYMEVGSVQYYNLGLSTEPKIVAIGGTTGTLVANSAAVNSQDEWFWTTAGDDTLFIFTTTAADTSNIEAGQRNYGIVNGKDYITIDGLEIKYTNSDGIIASDADGSYMTVQNCTIHDIGDFVNESGNGVRCYASNSTISDNTIYECGSHCIYIVNNTYDNTGCLIESNTVYDSYHNNIDLSCGGAGTVFGDHIVRYNQSYTRSNIGHDVGGIYVKGKDDTTMANNINVYYNVIKNTTLHNIQIGGDTDSIYVYNNTCGGTVDANTANIYLSSDSLVIVKNNIGIDAVTWSTRDVYDAGTWDYNCWYNAPLIGRIESTDKNWVQWQAAGHDANGMESDPLFTDAAGNDFTLQSTSPAIDAGVDVGLVLDYTGNTVPFNARYDRFPDFDIGAIEYRSLVSSWERWSRINDDSQWSRFKKAW